MPDVNFYLKKDDVDKWNALPSKSNFVHEALELYAGFRTVKLPQLDKPIPVPKDKGMCKNGHIADHWGRCLDKSCKYGR